ncbi:MAG: peptidoglycan DD-metalloendopeptidase family protein [bacterium]
MNLYQSKPTNKIILLIILLFLGSQAVLGQSSKELNKIRSEIKDLESQLKTKKNQEQSLLEKIEDINRTIGLQRKLIIKLNEEKQRIENDIGKTENQLSRVQAQYIRLREIVKKRIVSLYKKGRVADWAVLLSSGSFNQAVVWLKYLKIIMDNDKRNLNLLKKKEQQIQTYKAELNRKLKNKKQIIQEKNQETQEFTKRKKDRDRMLHTIQQDEKFLQSKIEKKKAAFEAIKNRIRTEESKRQDTHDYKKYPGTGFERLKGKLNWPVGGTVVQSYGTNRDRSTESWYDNLGVDIKAIGGELVKAVAKGRVTYVTWMRGMGNLVLVDHGEGYYTVYGYLDMVMVDKDMDIRAGDNIGRIGYEDNLYGPTLHFEIWNGENHYNPKTWLR